MSGSIKSSGILSILNNMISYPSSSSLSTSSFLSGLLVGSACTAVAVYYVTFNGRKRTVRIDDGDNDNEYESGASSTRTETPRMLFLRGLHKKLRHNTLAAHGAIDSMTASFFTRMINEMWDHIRIAAADQVQSTIEPYFVDMPSPINTCRFTKVDLGSRPFKMNNMVVHPKTCDFVQWDFDFEWDSDCDIQIRADFIGGFGIKHLKVFGRMAIIFNPLINEIPIVSAISYSFINLPNVDLTFTGLASVAEIGVIKQSVEDVIKVSMASSCLPHRRIYKMTKGGGPNGFLDIYRPPIGVVKIHIESGRGFVIEKRLFAPDDVPDVYLNVFFGAVVPGSSEGVRRTKTIMDECYPVWNETFEFLLWDRGQDIRLEAWDEDEGPLDPDDQLGVSSVTVADLLMSPQRRKELPLYNKEGEKTGEYVTLSCSIDSWTANLSSLLFDARDVKSDQVEKSVDSICGLLVVIINRAFNLPLDKKTAVTHVRTTFNGKEYKSNVVYDYPGYMDALNPVYDSAFTIPLTSSMPLKEDTRITLELMNEPIDEDDSLDPIVVGSTSVTLWELKKHPHNTLTQRRSIDATKNGPILEFRLSLSGIIGQSPSGNIINAGISSPINALPIMSPEHTKGTGDIANREINFEVLGTLGTARITVVGARGLKIEAHLFDFDVPDCYCVVSCGDTKDDEDDGVKRIFTTSIKHNNTSPTWNEHHDWPLEDHGEMVTVTLWDHDEDGRGEDTILGSAKTTIGKLLMAGGPAEVELRKSGRMTGIFLSLQCDIVI